MIIAAEHRQAFLRHIETLAQITRAEPGCISFACYEDMAAPNAFIVLQQWESRAALEQHEQAEYLAEFKANGGPMIVSGEETRVYTVSPVGKL